MRIESWAGLVCLVLAGVAHAEPDPKDIKLHQQKGTILQLERQVGNLQGEKAALEAKLALAETRLGLRPFAPAVLKPGQPSWHVKPGKVVRIDAVGTKPVKVDIEKHLEHTSAYVVAYWATWCKPCTTPEEIAALKRLETDLAQLGRPLLGVAVDGLNKVQKHERAAEWYYPIWHHKDAHIDWLPEKFIKSAGLGLPLFLVVSGEGELLFSHSSLLTPEVHAELLTAAARGRR